LSWFPAASRAQPCVVFSQRSNKPGPQFMRPYFCGSLTSGMLQFAPQMFNVGSNPAWVPQKKIKMNVVVLPMIIIFCSLIVHDMGHLVLGIQRWSVSQV
jgi:hypothetical protein